MTLTLARKRWRPTGAMFDAGHFLAEFAFVGSRNLMPDKLLCGLRMLAFGQAREVLRPHCAGELPIFGQPALPFAVAQLVTAPIVLLLGCKLALVIGSRLASGQRFRDCEHGISQSISFVSFQTNASLGLSLGASKSGRTGWMGLFNGSADAVEGAGIGLGAFLCVEDFAISSSLNRTLPILILILHLWDKLGRGAPHSVRSLSLRLRADQLCHMLRPASTKKSSTAPQSRGVRVSSTSANNDKGLLR